jgi:hypothetical protein
MSFEIPESLSYTKAIQKSILSFRPQFLAVTPVFRHKTSRFVALTILCLYFSSVSGPQKHLTLSQL